MTSCGCERREVVGRREALLYQDHGQLRVNCRLKKRGFWSSLWRFHTWIRLRCFETRHWGSDDLKKGQRQDKHLVILPANGKDWNMFSYWSQSCNVCNICSTIYHIPSFLSRLPISSLHKHMLEIQFKEFWTAPVFTDGSNCEHALTSSVHFVPACCKNLLKCSRIWK